MEKLPVKKFWTRKSCGFSLTEMMVVVGIFSVVAAFGIPHYGEVVRKNRERDVISVLESMRAAGLVYRSERGTFWDTADVWVTNLGSINGTLGIQIVDASGLPITYGYIYETANGNDTHAVRASWSENGENSTIEIHETGGRVVTGPCCNDNGGTEPCATPVAKLLVCP